MNLIFLLRYDLTTFSIDLLPAAKEILDEHVKNQLLNKQNKATHVVKKVIIGAFVDINITATHKISQESQNISGIVSSYFFFIFFDVLCFLL